MDVDDRGKHMLRPAVLTLAVSLACACLLPMSAFAAGQAASPAPASAAAPTQTPIVLRVDTGSVMVSDGGAFAPANTGTVLQLGDRLMVAEGGIATVFVNDRCSTTYDAPGVYVVTPECERAAAAVPRGATIGIVGGVIALGALAGGGGGGGDAAPPPPPPPPVSR